MRRAHWIVITASGIGAFLSQAAYGQCAGTWVRVSESGPSPRSGHALAYDAERQMVILFGGGYTQTQSDTWGWDGSRWQLLQSSGPLGARFSAAMSYDPVRKRVVLTGGFQQGVGFRDDTWAWNGSDWELVSAGGFGPRQDHAMAFDPGSQRMVLVSGYAASGWFSDTWTLNGTTWEQSATFGYPTPGTPALCSDPLRSTLVLLGGSNSNNGLTYEWDGQFWTQTSNFGPTDRYYGSMCFNRLRGRIQLFGGIRAGGGPMIGDTWEYNGATRLWTLVAITGPSPRYTPIAYDESREATLLFGGGTQSGPGVAGDTWVRTAAPVVRPSRIRQWACPVGTTSVMLEVLANAPSSYQWQVLSTDNAWINLTDGANAVFTTSDPIVLASGTTTGILTIGRQFVVGQPKVGTLVLRCRVANACGTIVSSPTVFSTCLADADCSGDLTTADIFSYLNQWFSGSIQSDTTADGELSIQDVFVFLNAWFAGC